MFHLACVYVPTSQSYALGEDAPLLVREPAPTPPPLLPSTHCRACAVNDFNVDYYYDLYDQFVGIPAVREEGAARLHHARAGGGCCAHTR